MKRLTENDKKYAVYLTELDWRAVVLVLNHATLNDVPSIGHTVWKVGAKRLNAIASTIESKLPKPASVVKP